MDVISEKINWHYIQSVLGQFDIRTIRIHKYCIIQSARKTQQMAYFWKEDFSRISQMIFPYVKQANTKMQVHKYTNTEHTTKWQKKTCGIFLKQLYNSSNMKNAESAQFTRSSFQLWFQWVAVVYYHKLFVVVGGWNGKDCKLIAWRKKFPRFQSSRLYTEQRTVAAAACWGPA